MAITKTNALLIGSIMLTSMSFAQVSSTKNNTIKNIIQVDGITDVSQVNLTIPESNTQFITYLDGLWRPVEQVSLKNSPLKQDIVTPLVYDSKGRESRKYLPIVTQTNGAFTPINTIVDPVSGNYIGIAQTFYSTSTDKVADDAKPFAQTIFDSSPLDLVVEQGSPGATWQPGTNHTIKKKYLANSSNEIYLFNYDPISGAISLSTDPLLKFYAPNSLYANTTIDEHQNQVIEYLDKNNRSICKKVQYATNGSVKLYAITYYLYDDFGNLVVVLPPEAVNDIIATVGY